MSQSLTESAQIIAINTGLAAFGGSIRLPIDAGVHAQIMQRARNKSRIWRGFSVKAGRLFYQRTELVRRQQVTAKNTTTIEDRYLYVLGNREMTTHDLAKILDKTPSACYYHLNTLHKKGLVRKIFYERGRGRNAYWRVLNDEPNAVDQAYNKRKIKSILRHL